MGIAFVYCFFLMEETNYDRQAPQTTLSTGSSTEAVVKPNATTEKTDPKDGESDKNDDLAVVEMGWIAHPRKTYLQKLSVIDKRRPNRILEIMWSPFKFFTFPIVVWAGFMYGTNGLVVSIYFPSILAPNRCCWMSYTLLRCPEMHTFFSSMFQNS